MAVKRRYSRGFTIVEMSIAMAFLAVLLIAILTLTVGIGKMYVKGVTNKTMNQAGKGIEDTLRRDFLSSSASNISSSIITVGGKHRLCLGKVSYLWNDASVLRFTGAPDETSLVTRGHQPVRLARVVDPGSSMCTPDINGKYTDDLTSVTSDNFAELIGGYGQEFALYSLQISALSTNNKRGLYKAVYTLGTNEANTTQGVAPNVSCLPSNVMSANFNYCAITDFEIVIRAGGGLGA